MPTPGAEHNSSREYQTPLYWMSTTALEAGIPNIPTKGAVIIQNTGVLKVTPGARDKPLKQ